MQRSRLASGIVLVLVLGSPAPASAALRGDEPEELAAGQGFDERSHDVDVTLDGAVARYRVRRVLEHPGGAVLELNDSFALPEGGAVTGFRVGFDGQLLRGQVMPADVAAARYEALRGPGDAPPRLFGLLSWEGTGRVAVAAYPIFPGEKLVVEYDVTAPLGYAGGQLVASYPGAERHLRAAHLRARASWAGAQLVVDPAPVPGLDAAPPRRIVARPPAIDVVTARVATVALAKDRHVVRWELEVAPVLGQVPRRARVVFIVDASWSQGEAGVAAQLAVARGYLSHVPDADFAIVGYARDARAATPGWVPAGTPGHAFVFAAASPALAPRNGSDPAAGLRAAAALVRGETRPVRVVLLSDLALAKAFTPERALAAAAALPRGAILHVVVRAGDSAGDLTEARSEDGRLGPAADAHGGQVLSIDGDQADAAAWSAVTLGLVRPIRLDDVTVELAGLPGETEGYEPVVAEGEGYRIMTVESAAPTHVVVSGRRWAETVQRRVALSPALAAELPALAIGDASVESSLEDADVERLGLGFGLITRATSLFAEATGAEPAVTGDETMTGCTGGTYSGHSSCGTSCRMGIALGFAVPVDWAQQLEDAIAPGVAACARARGVERAAFRLTVEMTDEEIVSLKTDLGDAKLRACVDEAIWAVHLPAIFRGHTWRDVVIDVAAAAAPAAPTPAGAPATPAR